MISPPPPPPPPPPTLLPLSTQKDLLGGERGGDALGGRKKGVLLSRNRKRKEEEEEMAYKKREEKKVGQPGRETLLPTSNVSPTERRRKSPFQGDLLAPPAFPYLNCSLLLLFLFHQVKRKNIYS